MTETNVNIADILEAEELAPSTATEEPGDDAEGKDAPTDHVPFHLDKNAREVDAAIKAALERALDYPELPVVMVDLVSPGLAVTRLQADWLIRLEPWQHALIAFGLIFATALMTNPDLRGRLKAGAARKKGMKDGQAPKNPPKPKTTGDPI